MGRNVRRRLSAGVAAAALGGALLATPAEATIGWNPGTVVVPDGSLEESRPQVAVDSEGSRHVVFHDENLDVWLVEVGVRGDVARPVQLFESTEDEFGGYPRIAVDDQDRITVVWYVTDWAPGKNSRVEARTVSADGQLGETQVLSDPEDNAYYPELAVDSSGVATVVWETEIGGGHPGTIQAVRLAAGTGVPLGPVLDLDGPVGEFPEGIGVGDLTLAMDQADRATVAWARRDGDPDGNFRNATIRAVRLSPDGVPGATQAVSDDPSVDFRYPQAVVAPDGTVTIVYTGFDDIAGTMANRLSSTDGTPGTPFLVSDPDLHSLDDPAAAVDGQGRVTVAWVAYGPEGDQVETRRIGADGSLEPERAPLGRKGATAGRLEMIAIASDPDGRVHVAWPGADGRATRMHGVRLASSDGAPSTTHRLSSPGVAASFDEVIDIAVDARDRASVVWSRGGATAVRRSRAPGLGPVPADTRILSGPRDGKVVQDATPRFRFEADTVEAVFQCRVDDRRWRPCSAPMTTRSLPDGRHRFRVRAIDADGTGAGRPAVARFRVR